MEKTAKLIIDGESVKAVKAAEAAAAANRKVGEEAESANKKIVNSGGQASKALDQVSGSAGKAAKSVDELGGKSRRVRSLSDEVKRLAKETFGLSGVARQAAAAFGVVAIIRSADAYTNLSSKIRTVVDNESQLVRVRANLFRISQDTRTSFEGTAELYSRLARATERLNLSETQLSGIVTTINKAFVVSGATANEAYSSIIQLSQGLAAGALRGEEFNSVAEQAPALLQLLQDALGVTRGELRKMAEQGQLTTELLVEAFQSGAADKIANSFEKMTLTIGGAIRQLLNSLVLVVGQFNDSTGVFTGVANVISFVAANLKSLAVAATAAGGAYLLKYVPGALAAATSTTTLTTSLSALRVALLANPIGLIVTAAAAAAFAISELTEAEAERRRQFEESVDVTREAVDLLDELVETANSGTFQPKFLNEMFEAATKAREATDLLIAKQQELAQLAPIKEQEDLFNIDAIPTGLSERVQQLNEDVAELTELNNDAQLALSQTATIFEQVYAPAVDVASAAIDAIVDSIIAGDIPGAVELMVSGFSDFAGAIDDVNSRKDELQGLFTIIQQGAEKSSKELETAGKTNLQIAVSYRDQLQQVVSGLPEAFKGLTAELSEQADAWVNNEKAIQKAKNAAKDAARAQREALKDAREVTKDLNTRQRAYAELERIIRRSTGAVDEITDAYNDHAAAIEKANDAADRAIDADADLTETNELLSEAISALNIELEARLKLIEANRKEDEEAADITGEVIRSLNEEIRLLGLSDKERRVEEIVLRAVADARREANAQQNESIALDSAEQASLRATVTAMIDQIDALEQNKRAAEDWQKIWESAAQSVSDAISEFIVDGLDDWEDFADSLLDIVKQMVKQMISEFLKLQVINPIINGILGTSLPTGGSGGGFNLTSLLGGGSGDGGGLFGGSAGSLLPVAGAVLGAGYGFTQRGTSNGSIGSLGAAAAYGTAGYIGGTIAYGATLGAAAGAGTAAGVAGGAASGAIGAAGAIPVVGWVIAAIAAVDLITGGKVFGTRYRPEESTTSLAIGEGGGTASASLQEVRERALFGGKKRRTSSIDPGDDAREAAAALYDAVYGNLERVSSQLSSEIAPVIDASIDTIIQYDKKGREKGRKILVNLLGESWEEANEELAATRILAESTIQAIDFALGGIATGVESTGALDSAEEFGSAAGSRYGEELGRSFHKSLSKAEESVAEAIEGGGGGIAGEASAVAQRWRGNAEQLMEGAEFLLLAATDIKAGVALLGEDESLRSITELTEDLQVSGETLSQTYQRMAISTALFENALSLAEATVDKTREELVRFSVDIVDAAGGLDRAQALWSSYFQTFYTEQERGLLALEQAKTAASREFDDIGQDLSDFTGPDGGQAFRDLFESLLPTLSAEAVVEWLEAANALGIVIDLQTQYTDTLAATAEAQEEFMQSIRDQIDEFAPPLSFAERIAQINQEIDELIVKANDLNLSEADIQEIRELGMLRVNQVLEEQAEAMNDYRLTVRGLQDELDELNGLSDFQIAIRDIGRWTEETTRSLNEAARAAGLQAASENDLSIVHQIAAARIEQAIQRLSERGRSIVEELYGTPLERVENQISALEQASSAQQQFVDDQLSGIDDVAQASEELYRRQLSAIQRIQDYLYGFNLGPNSRLRPRDQLDVGFEQFSEQVALALGGDVDALEGITGLADQLFNLIDLVYGSAEPGDILRDQILEALGSLAGLQIEDPTDPVDGSPVGPVSGTGGYGVTSDLQQLYNERDQLLAEQTAAQRLALAQELTGIIADLISATGDPLQTIADSLNVQMSDLVADLGVNLSDLSASTASQLADIAQSMGVNLSDLAASVGVDLGDLADAQSLLNDALEAEIQSLPEDQRAELEPLLTAVEQAALLGDNDLLEAAQQDLINAVINSPASIRNALAPYFEDIEPIDYDELSSLTNIDYYVALGYVEQQAQTALQLEMRDLLANMVNSDGGGGYQAPTYPGGPTVPGVGPSAVSPPTTQTRSNVRSNQPDGSNNDALMSEVLEELRRLRQDTATGSSKVAAAISSAGGEQTRAVQRQTDAIKTLSR